MVFDALGGLPLGGIPDDIVTPAPPIPGGTSIGGSRFDESMFSRPVKKDINKELAILLAAYVEFYKD